MDRRDGSPRTPWLSHPRRKRVHDAGGPGLHLRCLGHPKPAWRRRREILGRVGERLGSAAGLSKNQARGLRDERPRTPRLRELGIPPGTSVGAKVREERRETSGGAGEES